MSHADLEEIKCLLENDKPEEASTAIRKALELHPDDRDLICLQGELYVKLGKLGSAENIFSDILYQAPKNITALNNLACVKIFQKKWIEAINLLQRAWVLDNACTDAVENLNFIKSENAIFEDISESSLHRTICATFPRSGHNLLYQFLTQYFMGDFHYCEFYHHCNKVPCPDHRTNFQKNHDLRLSLFNNPSYNYVVQYRHPIEAIISWYKFDLKAGGIKEGNTKAWLKFLHEKIVFWKNFVRKWIINNKNPYTFYLEYTDMVNDPHTKLRQIVNFLQPAKPADSALITDIVNRLDIRFRNNMKDFEYYDPVLFGQIEAGVKKELTLLELNSHFA